MKLSYCILPQRLLCVLASFQECLLLQLYATLDEAALQSQGSSRTPDEAHPEPTQYASIEFGKNGDREVPRADLV